MTGAMMLELEKVLHRLRPARMKHIVFGDVPLLHFVLRQIDATEGSVLFDVAQNIGELERHAERNGVIDGLLFLVAEDFDADEADGAGDAVTVLAQSGKIGIAGDGEIHFHATKNFLEMRRWNEIGANDPGQLLPESGAWFIEIG